MAIFRGTGGAGDATNDITINQVTELTQDAEAAATAAASSATSAALSASDAATSEANAATSESNASTSATNASNSASTASDAATAASNAQTAAETAETNAETAETNAETAQAAAEDAQNYAEEWATKAEDSLVSTDAGGDGSTDYSALHHAAKASASATAASDAQTGAETAQGLAEDAQTAAETAQGLAEDAKDDAVIAKNDAESAQSAAESARDQTLTAFDNFDDRYLGVKSSDPSLDNDGDALVSGALYFNSVDSSMKVYDGSQWLDAYANGATFLVKANNLSDLTSASTARTNLGLGTAATLDVGTGANNVVQLDGSGALPAVDGSNLTNVSSVANLNDLTDVDTTGVEDGNTIVYDDATSTWVVGSSLVNGTAQRYKYTATAAQTSFSGTDDNGVTLAYDPGYIDVYLNGVHLDPSDYTATTGTSIVLDTGAALNDELYIVAFGNFQVADTVSKADGGTFDSAVTFADGITVDNDGATVATFDRATSDGTIVEYQKDGTTIGIAGASSSHLYVGDNTGATGAGLHFVNNQIRPFDAKNGSSSDAEISLGSGDHRFTDLYLSGDAKFNSGYGSTATAYGCRAWVNFNGNGTVAIRDSGNVSSITDGGTGTYTVNFATAMPDVNYAVTSGDFSYGVGWDDTYTTTSVRTMRRNDSFGAFDVGIICVMVVR